jgi:predicted Rossmann fold flavoprotein
MDRATYDVVVIGAGAAGLMCAMTAGRRGRRVLLLDHAEAAGKKILISGGGRCNFTNLNVAADRFLSANPHFCKSALARYTQHDFIALVDRHHIPWHEKTLGQLFCDGSARAIMAMLLEECAAAEVELRLGQQVSDIQRVDGFIVRTLQGDVAAPAVVLATGGLSIPKMGATGFAHDVARRFGLALTEITPGLVPLTFADETLAFMRGLSGVPVEVVARCGRAAFQEAMLFTHRGLSGPVILQVSSFWRDGMAVTLDLLPGHPAGALLARKRVRPKLALRTALGEMLPQRLAQALADRWLPWVGKLADIPDRALRALEDKLKAWELRPDGTEGYAKAEVTVGGVDTNCLSSHSMQATRVPGLFVVGEAVDVTGWLGGYNFQWAWSSGWCAGMAV